MTTNRSSALGFPIFVILAAISSVVVPTIASAQSGVQITPDRKRVLIGKDLGP